MSSPSPQSAPLASPLPAKNDWPHAPSHRLSMNGTYMVTAGTYLKEHFFKGEERLDYLEGMALSLAKHYGWQIEAWAVFSNHYHFVAHSPLDGTDATSLRTFLSRLHTQTAIKMNKHDGTPGRKVWYNFWDSRLTYEKSYLARLHYVHANPVKHKLVLMANEYPWCSAAWFERTASPAMVKTIYSFKIDELKVLDDF
jgi:putative transposase